MYKYTNGNYKVEIYEDGTKVRETNGDKFFPAFPESMDLKVTNYCDLDCPFCHEKSDTDGVHGDLDKVLDNLEGLPAGVEIACGGGLTLSHPSLELFLRELKSRGLIANVTMNARHLISLGTTPYERMIRRFIDQGLVKGVGVSWDGVTHFKYEHAVCHVITGVHPFSSIKRALDLYGKIIILGYKQFGRGTEFYNQAVQDNIDHLKDNLWQILGRGKVVSFDNLALKQLDVRSHLTDAAWDTFYMGNDGCFTMYYDAVKQQYAKSSISERANVDCGVITYFQRINHVN